ncbi:hypothetical protein EP7_002902 [Isosphaeraceae bacterium EP7]
MTLRAWILGWSCGLLWLTAATQSHGQEPAAAAAQADPAALAAQVLDEKKPAEEREAVIAKHPELSSALISAMAAGMPAGTPEEYRRIPWIWRAAFAAGKRNDEAELRRILEVSLPAPGAPLDDWRAVVVGGGLINGLTLAGVWPAERLGAVVAGNDALIARWRRALDLASAMADDEKVKTGTRYDALRMLGAEPWDRRGAQLMRYLTKGVDAELQQGAVSALSDVKGPAPVVAQALLSGFDHYSPNNREFALDALLRDEARALALLDAVKGGRVDRGLLGTKRTEALKAHPVEPVRALATSVLGAP